MAKRRGEEEITVTGAEEPEAMLEQPAGASHPDAYQDVHHDAHQDAHPDAHQGAAVAYPEHLDEHLQLAEKLLLTKELLNQGCC